MIAYKATKNFKCIDIIYEVGKTYTFDGKIDMCFQGFHFCKLPDDVFNYYDYDEDLVILEVEILGKVIDEDDKSVTDKLKVLREIPKSEYNKVFKKHTFNDDKQLIYKTNDKIKYYYIYNDKGQLIETRDSSGFWKHYQYDENGNKVYTENSWGYITFCTYDQNNNRTYKKDNYTNWGKWEYDENNNLIRYLGSYNNYIEYEYNDKNQLIAQKDYLDNWYQYEYDDNAKLKYKSYSKGTLIPQCECIYDNIKNTITKKVEGKIKYTIIIE